MKDWVTVWSFTYYSSLIIAQAKLESEGIETSTADVMTTHAQPFYSNAIGGIKLQVRLADYDFAVDILLQSGYIDEEGERTSEIFQVVEKVTDHIPLLNRVGAELRLMIFVVLGLMVLGISLYYKSRKSRFEILTQNEWCLETVNFQGNTYVPVSLENRSQLSGKCREQLIFNGSGELILLGFENQEIDCRWTEEEGEIRISGSSTFPHIFNGTYTLDIEDDRLTLRSETTVIYCYF